LIYIQHSGPTFSQFSKPLLVLCYGFMALAKKKKSEVSKDEDRESQGDAETSMFKNQIHMTCNTG